MGPQRVAIIVINWNGAELTKRCLASLYAQDYPDLRVIVVDNGSTDSSAADIGSAFPQAQMAVAGRNLGYAGGCNRGIEEAGDAAYLWFLNNDTVVDSGAVSALVKAAQSVGSAAILGPKILFMDRPDVIWFAGGILDRFRMKGRHRGIYERDNGQYERLEPVDWISGCALFCDRALIRSIGGWDERYFLYLEDLDWCLSAARAGHPLYFVPSARLWHEVSHSTGSLNPWFVRYYSYRNYYLLARKHARGLVRARLMLDVAWTFLKIGLRWSLSPSYRHNTYYHARTAGLFDFARGRFGRAPDASEPKALVEGLSAAARGRQ